MNQGYSGIPGLCTNTPNGGEIVNNGQPISLGVYDRGNKLPYTINYTLDLQWQPRNDLAIELGYVGNTGRHQVIPVPFNQPTINSKSNAALSGGACPQWYSYGYNVGFNRLPAGSCFGTQPVIWPRTKAVTWICASPILAMRLNRSHTLQKASTTTTRCRRTWKSA